MALVPFNVSLAPGSPLFTYSPFRNGDVTTGWHSSYTGASAVDIDEPMGFAFRRTQADSAEVSVSFFGTAIFLCIDANGSHYNFTVDGRESRTTVLGSDAACANYGVEAMLVSSGLDAVQHTATLSVSATTHSEFHFFGATLTMGVNTNGYAAGSNVIANQASDWRFLSVTYPLQTPAVHKGKLKTRSLSIAHMLFSVDLDGRTVDLNASSSWSETGIVLFAQGNLDPGSHHRLTVRNHTNAPSPCNLASNLKLVLLTTSGQARAMNDSVMPDMPDMFMTAAIGGAAGGFAAMVTLFFIILCYVRRLRGRQRRARDDLALHAPRPFYLPVRLTQPDGNGLDSKPFLHTGFDAALEAGVARIANDEPSSAVSTRGSRNTSAVETLEASGRRVDLEQVIALFNSILHMDSWRRGVTRVETSDSLPSYRA
ncbi:hypothetical protein AURDEDRAFT_171405 [Auricularia subglabra TFB-10046 SS5]|uniref:Uncharacterized protein n=1 Tax=Auricularia subglabra (strain TFB-10046 / SS5) TaxID=717982 RepID=J0LIY8_AURST|nr:hypothetical protein AURDEDRAFT_171405 [Auricularia subglabra TFB-10046 SS5]